MTEDSLPPLVRVKYQAECVSDSLTNIEVAGHVVVTDEPEHFGGTNVAAAPVQTFLAALPGCINVFANKCARKLGVEIISIGIEMEAEVDRRGILMQKKIKVPFPSISISADVKTNATDAQWDQVVACIRQSCPIAVVLRASGTTIHENWNLIRD